MGPVSAWADMVNMVPRDAYKSEAVHLTGGLTPCLSGRYSIACGLNMLLTNASCGYQLAQTCVSVFEGQITLASISLDLAVENWLFQVSRLTPTLCVDMEI